jgi:hypothetical protein
MSAKTVTVVVLAGNILYRDGRAHLEGQHFEVSTAEARTLAEQGVVARP